MSYQMETTIHLPRRSLPPIKVLCEAWDMTPIAVLMELDGLGPEDEFPDLDVSVEFEGGWFTPGKYWGAWEDSYPDEGEDPELTKVTLLGSSYDLLSELPQEVHDALTREAWSYQQADDADARADSLISD